MCNLLVVYSRNCNVIINNARYGKGDKLVSLVGSGDGRYIFYCKVRLRQVSKEQFDSQCVYNNTNWGNYWLQYAVINWFFKCCLNWPKVNEKVSESNSKSVPCSWRSGTELAGANVPCPRPRLLRVTHSGWRSKADVDDNHSVSSAPVSEVKGVSAT